MTGDSPPARRGRRDNGLDARAFAPVSDVDPRVGEHLLELLRDDGIAAYLEPSSDRDGFTRATVLPSRPTDRLWADTSRLRDAHRLVGVAAADPAPTDEDRAWRELVAGFSRSLVAEVPPWPASEDVDERPPRDSGRRVLRRASDRDAEDPGIDADDLDDEPGEVAGVDPADEDHFEPPPPPPVPRASRATLTAMVLVLLGGVLLVAPGVVGIAEGDLSLALATLCLLGGVGSMVWRLHDGPQPDDGPDDGAVV